MSKSITLDARKVIKYINDSAQSHVHVMEEALSRLAQKTGRKYRLVALHPKNVMFEDSSGQYYLADYAKSRGNRINLSNVTEVNIEESKKSHVFNNACVDLVESISNEDEKGSEIAFRKLESCRFRSTVTSNDGYVITKDGQRRRFLTESPVMSKSSVDAVLESISAAMKEDVVLEDNHIISAKIGNVDLKLPITETMRRCNVAKKMKTVAEDAWQSPKFQKFVNNVAGMVSKDMIKEAVVESAKFLKEYQEFSLLNLSEMETLVESTLATANQYNPILAENTALLLYKTNTRANKNDIMSAWEKTARVASDPALLEEVYNLSKSEDFNNDYQVFLHKVLVEETEVPQDVLKTTLLVLKKVLSDAVETMGDKEEAREVEDDTVEAVNTALSDGSEDVFEGVDKSSAIIEQDETLAKYKRAIDEIEDMISGVDAGDPDQMQAATDLVSAIDTDQMMSQETLQNYGTEEDIGEIGAGEVADAAEEMGEEGEEELDLGAEEEDLGGLGAGAGEAGLEDLDLGAEAPAEEPGEEETFGLGEEEAEEAEEGEEEEEELGEPDLSFESKDTYGDYSISESQDIDDKYGTKDENKEESIVSADEIVADLHDLFESENPFAPGGPLAKEKKTEGDGMVSDEEKNEDEEEEDDKDLPGDIEKLPPALQKQAMKKVEGDGVAEGVEDIKNKDVISGDEGVSAESGAAEDSMPKDLGGEVVGGKKVKTGGEGAPKTNPGNKGSDSDLEQVGDKNPIKRSPENDDSSATLKESTEKPAFNKGPFKKVK